MKDSWMLYVQLFRRTIASVAIGKKSRKKATFPLSKVTKWQYSEPFLVHYVRPENFTYCLITRKTGWNEGGLAEKKVEDFEQRWGKMRLGLRKRILMDVGKIVKLVKRTKPPGTNVSKSTIMAWAWTSLQKHENLSPYPWELIVLGLSSPTFKLQLSIIWTEENQFIKRDHFQVLLWKKKDAYMLLAKKAFPLPPAPPLAAINISPSSFKSATHVPLSLNNVPTGTCNKIWR